MQNLPAVPDAKPAAPPSAPESLAPMRSALDRAENDVEREQVRRAAAGAEAAARSMDLPAVETEAACLVRSAEREIVNANPPIPPGERRRAEMPSYRRAGIPRALMSQLRALHRQLTDWEFSEALTEARSTRTPPTRRYLTRYARSLRQPDGEDLPPETEPPPASDPDVPDETGDEDEPPADGGLAMRCFYCDAPPVFWDANHPRHVGQCFKHFMSDVGLTDFVAGYAKPLREAIEEYVVAALVAPPETNEVGERTPVPDLPIARNRPRGQQAAPRPQKTVRG